MQHQSSGCKSQNLSSPFWTYFYFIFLYFFYNSQNSPSLFFNVAIIMLISPKIIINQGFCGSNTWFPQSEVLEVLKPPEASESSAVSSQPPNAASCERRWLINNSFAAPLLPPPLPRPSFLTPAVCRDASSKQETPQHQNAH